MRDKRTPKDVCGEAIDKSLSTSIKEGSAAIRFQRRKANVSEDPSICATPSTADTHTHNSFFVDLKTE